jgi:hypothetical protein
MFARYAYVVSNKAYQSPKGHSMSKYAKMDGLVEFVHELREAGTPWDKEGGIVTQVKDRFPGYTTNSAIPLRNLYHAHLASLEKGEKIAKSSKAVTKARDSGMGWHNIAGRAGITVAAAKKLYTGEHPDGRIYVDQDGKISTVKTDWDRPDTDEADTDTETTEPVDGDAPDTTEAATTDSTEVAA